MCFSLTESCNVQYSDVIGGALEGKALVDPGHNVVKEADVEGLGQGVPGVGRLVWFQGNTERGGGE